LTFENKWFNLLTLYYSPIYGLTNEIPRTESNLFVFSGGAIAVGSFL